MRLALLAICTVAVVAVAQDRPKHGPPPESLAACANLSSGTACAFTHDGRNLTGTCRTGPGEALACAPAGMGPGGPGGHHGPPPESLAACTAHSSGEACSFSHDGLNLTGTCEPGPDGALGCRPVRP